MVCGRAGLREGQLLFRFGETDGWERVAEPLGSVSYGQAWQCRRKSILIGYKPYKAAEISFSYPLWDAPADTATAIPGTACQHIIFEKAFPSAMPVSIFCIKCLFLFWLESRISIQQHARSLTGLTRSGRTFCCGPLQLAQGMLKAVEANRQRPSFTGSYDGLLAIHEPSAQILHQYFYTLQHDFLKHKCFSNICRATSLPEALLRLALTQTHIVRPIAIHTMQ